MLIVQPVQRQQKRQKQSLLPKQVRLARLASSANYAAYSHKKGLHARRSLPLPHYTGGTSRYKLAEVKLKFPEKTITVAAGQDLIVFNDPATGTQIYVLETAGTTTTATDFISIVQRGAFPATYNLPLYNPLEAFITPEMGNLGSINAVTSASLDAPPKTQYAQGSICVTVAVPYDGLAQVAVVTADNAPQYCGENAAVLSPATSGIHSDPNLVAEVVIPRVLDDGTSRNFFTIAQSVGETHLQVGSSDSAVQSYRMTQRSERGWFYAGWYSYAAAALGTTGAYTTGFRPGGLPHLSTYGYTVIRNTSSTGVSLTATISGDMGLHVIVPDLTRDVSVGAMASKAFIRNFEQQCDFVAPHQRSIVDVASVARLEVKKGASQAPSLEQSSLHPHSHTDYISSAMSAARESLDSDTMSSVSSSRNSYNLSWDGASVHSGRDPSGDVLDTFHKAIDVANRALPLVTAVSSFF